MYAHIFFFLTEGVISIQFGEKKSLVMNFQNNKFNGFTLKQTM